ncbi:MAG: DUF4956 domain-containing protein [Candidatus Omnitrophota bacterium]
MNRLQTFQQFLATQNIQVSIFGYVVNLLLVALLSIILARIYVKYGTVLSNRRIFSNNFVMIAMVTMLVISIVKSSLALSLGLVGALSIVRFRAAIKEPEELTYLFLAIGIGLGFGANQRILTILAFTFICAVIILRKRHNKADGDQNLYLTIASSDPKQIGLGRIVEILKKHFSVVNMKRFDETKELLEASFLVETDSFDQLHLVKLELQKLSESIRITFLDNRGVF